MLALLFAATVALEVPYARQEADTCAAAALVMVASYWERPLVQADVARALLRRRDGIRGILGSELATFAGNHGLRAFAYEGDLDQLLGSLAKGRPLIVAWRFQEGRDHDVVVVGWDTERDVLIVHDPARGPRREVGTAEFERRWAAAGHWTLLVLPQVER